MKIYRMSLPFRALMLSAAGLIIWAAVSSLIEPDGLSGYPSGFGVIFAAFILALGIGMIWFAFAMGVGVTEKTFATFIFSKKRLEVDKSFITGIRTERWFFLFPVLYLSFTKGGQPREFMILPLEGGDDFEAQLRERG